MSFSLCIMNRKALYTKSRNTISIIRIDFVMDKNSNLKKKRFNILPNLKDLFNFEQVCIFLWFLYLLFKSPSPSFS